MAEESEKVDQVKPEVAPEVKADAAPEKKAVVAEAKGDAAPEEKKAPAPMDDIMADKPLEITKVKGKARVAPVGIAHIRSTFNNTMVCITDMRGGVVAWSTGGKTGFKGSRKSTAFAATMVGQDAARTAVGKGMHEVEVRVQGAGAGRESAIRALQATGLTISTIKDITPIPHNGCRPRKRRRV